MFLGLGSDMLNAWYPPWWYIPLARSWWSVIILSIRYNENSWTSFLFLFPLINSLYASSKLSMLTIYSKLWRNWIFIMIFLLTPPPAGCRALNRENKKSLSYLVSILSNNTQNTQTLFWSENRCAFCGNYRSAYNCQFSCARRKTALCPFGNKKSWYIKNIFNDALGNKIYW